MILILLISFILVLITIAFKKQLNNLAKRYFIVKILKFAFIILSCLFIFFLAFMGIGEMFSGDFSGIAHLITLIPFSIIAVLLIKN
jgi:hypothetical protein